MHRARVKAVSGNKVLADGTWLICIGNRTVREGEWVWTDGRCVYGHESEGGSSYVPTNALSGIPILQLEWKDNKEQMRYRYYAKGKLHDLRFGKDGGWMVNHGDRFAFLKTGLLDIEMDARGNVYTLGDANVLVDSILGTEVHDGVSHVRCNGEIVATYNLEKAFGTPPVDDPYDHYTCRPLEGRVDQQGRFKLLIWHQVSRKLWDGTWISSERHVVFDGTNIEPWSEESKTSWKDPVTGETQQSHTKWIAPDYSVRFPIYDGMYMLLPSDGNFMGGSGKCSTPIYNAQDELIMKIDTHAGGRVNVCPLGKEKYLVSMVPSSILGNETSELYLWEDGQLTLLMKGCLNRRLRRMSNLNKWKKAGGL